GYGVQLDDISVVGTAAFSYDLGRSLVGHIDDVRFWNRILPDNTIQRDYSRRLTGNESGLRGYWTFDENLTGYAFDMSRVGTVYNGNHALRNTLTFSDLVPDEIYQLALKGITDENGNYQINGIPFVGEGTSYSIVPSLGVHKFNPTHQLRYISPTSMVHNGTDFTDISSFTVKGTVVYAGGTYPVEGCSFEIDDQPVTRPNGELEKSGQDGTFTISVPIGIHKVRIVKPGHNFTNNGLLQEWFIDPETMEGYYKNKNYNANLNNVEFFDETRVKIIGRVVGGLIENDKPLGFGESVNNIGVQTITLGTSQLKYDFADPSDTQTFSHNQGQWKKPGGAIVDDYTTVTYNQKDIVIDVSPTTGEFVAYLYPELYNIGAIKVPLGGGAQLTVYDENESVNFSTAAVPNDDMMQMSVRTWIDSTFVAGQPGVLDHWEYVEKSDTIRYHGKWTFYYQATPTFGVQQVVNGDVADYFGEESYTLKDPFTGTSETLSLYNETTQDYLFDKPVFKQGNYYTFFMNAYEQYSNHVSDPVETVQYPVKNGKVNMMNSVKLSPSPETVDMDENGEALYTFLAGAPNLTTGSNDFFATLSLGAISYYWDLGTNPIDVWHLGDKTTGTDFMTAGPDEITAILRDPPGTRSKSYIETGTTITTKKSNSITEGMSTAMEFTTNLGPKLITFVGLGAGVITEAETKFDVSAGLKTEEKWTSESEFSTSTTFTERFETSDDPLYVGHYGDVFIGNSTNILYGLTNAITIIKDYANENDDAFETATVSGNEFSIAPAVSLAYGQSFDTRFAFTTVDIEDIMIPKWQDNLAITLQPMGKIPVLSEITRPIYVSNLPHNDPNFGKLNTDKDAFGNLASDPDKFHTGESYTIFFPTGYDMAEFVTDSVMYYNNQINGWISVLYQNEKEKVQMEKLGNYSFGSGVT
ncbi:MAG: hypothetical protein FWF09_08825, partial [Bacteroidales bacterium]|nr:hypothetical protein [Bacteroidales bacterium]